MAIEETYQVPHSTFFTIVLPTDARAHYMQLKLHAVSYRSGLPSTMLRSRQQDIHVIFFFYQSFSL